MDIEVGDRVKVVEGEEFTILGPPDPRTGVERLETIKKYPGGRLLSGKKGKVVAIVEHPEDPKYGLVARVEFPFGDRWVHETFLTKIKGED